jgi:hypothetical protein
MGIVMHLKSVSTAMLMALLAGHAARAVSVQSGTINGLAVDIWTWTDGKGHPRTIALKQEGNGNPGHGGYAVQMTYQVKVKKSLVTITVNAETGSDGGFGYFVSHERYRNFADGAVDTIASHIFNTDDSPLGLDFPAVTSKPSTPQGTGAERFTIQYGHYGTNFVDPVDPNTGGDSILLPDGESNYTFYTLPVTTTWVMQDGLDYPRLDIALGLAGVTLGGMPTADLVSFDMRGPYGVMVFDNGLDGTVDTVQWGDQAYVFSLLETPVTRNSTWNWSAANIGARYHALMAGAYEMGMFEPAKVAASATVDGYAAERGFTKAGYQASGGVSYSSCPSGAQQVMPSDGTWPYQSVQYSLSCSNFNDPTTGKKIAWGTTSFYGTSLTSVYDGQMSFPFNGFPASGELTYSVCLVLGKPGNGESLTQKLAAEFSKKKPRPDCSFTAVP